MSLMQELMEIYDTNNPRAARAYDAAITRGQAYDKEELSKATEDMKRSVQNIVKKVNDSSMSQYDCNALKKELGASNRTLSVDELKQACENAKVDAYEVFSLIDVELK